MRARERAHGTRLALLLGLAFLVSAGVMPAIPADANLGTLVERGPYPGPAWYVVRGSAADSTLRFTLSARDVSPPFLAYVGRLDGDGRFVSGVVTRWLGMETATRIQVGTPVGSVRVDEDLFGGEPSTPVRLVETTEVASGVSGEFYAFFLVVGTFTSWSLEVEGDERAAALAEQAGDTPPFLHGNEAFRGALAVEQGVVAGDVHVIAAGAVEKRASGRLVSMYVQTGAFAPPLGRGVDVLTRDGPDGRRDCPCRSLDLAGAGAAPPGDYRFGLTGAGADGFDGGLLLFGADAALRI